MVPYLGVTVMFKLVEVRCRQDLPLISSSAPPCLQLSLLPNRDIIILRILTSEHSDIYGTIPSSSSSLFIHHPSPSPKL